MSVNNTELRKRERKIVVENLSVQEAEQLSAFIGKEMAKIMDEANLKCLELLKPLGLESYIVYDVKKIGEPIEIIEEPKKVSKKGRPRKSLAK